MIDGGLRKNEKLKKEKNGWELWKSGEKRKGWFYWKVNAPLTCFARWHFQQCQNKKPRTFAEVVSSTVCVFSDRLSCIYQNQF